MQPKIKPVKMRVKASELIVGDVITDERVPYLTTSVTEAYMEEGLSGVGLVHVWDEMYLATTLYGPNQMLDIIRMCGE